MTKTLITIVIVVAVALGAWQLFDYWQKVSDEKEANAKTAAAAVVTGDSLPGMPYQYGDSLKAAQQQGADALGNWLKLYGPNVQDPRKAWIELDYVLLLPRQNPQEAKRVFNEVKDRTLPNSPVWPRIHDMEKSYQ
jgi:hypothetical protein